MSNHLIQKTDRYERLLASALASAEIESDANEASADLATEHLRMAEAYLADGRHFRAEDDYVTALAAFSYGHGWLDAAIRSDLVDGEGPESPVETRGV